MLKIEGGIFRPRTEKLTVGSRDCTKLVDGVLKQVDLVRRIVGADVPITGVLCFVEADWPLIGGGFTTRGVEVLKPRKLYPRLSADGVARPPCRRSTRGPGERAPASLIAAIEQHHAVHGLASARAASV